MNKLKDFSLKLVVLRAVTFPLLDSLSSLTMAAAEYNNVILGAFLTVTQVFKVSYPHLASDEPYKFLYLFVLSCVYHRFPALAPSTSDEFLNRLSDIPTVLLPPCSTSVVVTLNPHLP